MKVHVLQKTIIFKNLLKMQVCDMPADWGEYQLYSVIKSYQTCYKTVSHDSFSYYSGVCEKVRSIIYPNQHAWRFCCLLSTRTETNPTGLDFGWHPSYTILDILNGREEEDDDFPRSKKVKCLQTWGHDQMSWLSHDFAISWQCVTSGQKIYLSEHQYPCL